MSIRIADPSEMSRIGEIDRTETIRARYSVHIRSDGRSISIERIDLDPPEVFPNWDREGVKKRSKWWRKEVEAGGALFVYEANHKVKGFAVLGPHRSCDCAQMVALFVDKGFRKKGIGKALVKNLEQEARVRGINSIYVGSVNTVATVSFYEKMGYRISCLMDSTKLWIPGMDTQIALTKSIKEHDG